MAQRPAPVVQLRSGTVRGFWRGADSAAFLGIPYAAPPVGALRFAPPAPPAPWSGVRPACSYGPTPQRRPFDLITTIPEATVPGEETLNLNVHTPHPASAGGTSGGLPVLVWIHGGGFVAGSPASPWYDGASFNRAGVVVVTITYRLGFEGFGWLADAVPNRGVLDMVAALEWVRDNVEAFGGDPENVTVAGQSAGAAAVVTLAVTPRAAGLFRRGIAMSGLTRIPPVDGAVRAGELMARTAGVEPTREGWATVGQDRLLDLQDWLRRGRRDDPLYLPRSIFGHGDPLARFGPVVDGDLIPYDLGEARRRGLLTVPLLLGSTAHEYTLALPAAARAALDGLTADAALDAAGAPEEMASAIRQVHPELAGSLVVSQAWTDLNFRVPVVAFTAQPAHTWLYDFAWPSGVTGFATHGIDLVFAWGLPDADGVRDACGPYLPGGLVADMHRAWARFATDGDPGWAAAAGSLTGVRFGPEQAETDDLYGTERELHGLLGSLAGTRPHSWARGPAAPRPQAPVA